MVSFGVWIVSLVSFRCFDGFGGFVPVFNLVPRVFGLFGQRVSARKDSGIMDSIFPENVGSGLIAHA